MGVYIPNMEKPKECDGIGINIHFTDGHMELHILDECELTEIVECKDCKWCEKSGGILWCNIWHNDTNGLNFCSYAERRADEGVFSRG